MKLAMWTAIALTGCGSPRLPEADPWCQAVALPEGVSMSFPSPPAMRRVDERPFAVTLLMSARDDGDRVYELALFALPKRSTRERRALLASVEHGLSTRPGAVDHERGIVPLAGHPALALSIAQTGHRRGRHRIVYLDEQRMLQLSVVGSDDATSRERSEAFFDSFRLDTTCDTCCPVD